MELGQFIKKASKQLHSIEIFYKRVNRKKTHTKEDAKQIQAAIQKLDKLSEEFNQIK